MIKNRIKAGWNKPTLVNYLQRRNMPLALWISENKILSEDDLQRESRTLELIPPSWEFILHEVPTLVSAKPALVRILVPTSQESVPEFVTVAIDSLPYENIRRKNKKQLSQIKHEEPSTNDDSES